MRKMIVEVEVVYSTVPSKINELVDEVIGEMISVVSNNYPEVHLINTELISDEEEQ